MAASAGPALPDGVLLRRFAAVDLESAQFLTRDVQWPHRKEDWRFLLAHGEGVVAVRDGVLVGTAMRWFWGDRHATLGMVIVAPQWQGQRIGRQLMAAMMTEIEDRTILLHATQQGRGLYERLGFRFTGEIRQHQGIAVQPQPVEMLRGERLRPLGRSDVDALATLDAHAAGMPRGAMIRQLLTEGNAIVLARDTEIVGFSVLRRFGRGYIMGPVVAPDLAGAQTLIAHWCERHAGEFLRIDSDAGSGLAEWLEAAGLRQAGTAIAMVRGAAPERGPAFGGWALVSQATG